MPACICLTVIGCAAIMMLLLLVVVLLALQLLLQLPVLICMTLVLWRCWAVGCCRHASPPARLRLWQFTDGSGTVVRTGSRPSAAAERPARRCRLVLLLVRLLLTRAPPALARTTGDHTPPGLLLLLLLQ